MKFAIDNGEVIIEITSNKSLRGIHLNSPTVEDLENAIDRAFRTKIKNIYLHGPISSDLITEYSDFIVKEERGVLINVDFKNKKIIGVEKAS